MPRRYRALCTVIRRRGATTGESGDGVLSQQRGRCCGRRSRKSDRATPGPRVSRGGPCRARPTAEHSVRGRRACCGDAGAEPPDRRWRPASEGEARALRVVRHAVRRPRWRRSPNHQGPGRNAPGRLPKGAQRAREPRQPRYPNPVRRPRLTEGEGGGRVAKLGVHSEPGYQGRRPPDARLVAESGPGRNALVRTWAECPQEVQGRGPRAACPVYSGRVGGGVLQA